MRHSSHLVQYPLSDYGQQFRLIEKNGRMTGLELCFLQHHALPASAEVCIRDSISQVSVCICLVNTPQRAPLWLVYPKFSKITLVLLTHHISKLHIALAYCVKKISLTYFNLLSNHSLNASPLAFTTWYTSPELKVLHTFIHCYYFILQIQASWNNLFPRASWHVLSLETLSWFQKERNTKT